jgi:hypothetical protein
MSTDSTGYRSRKWVPGVALLFISLSLLIVTLLSAGKGKAALPASLSTRTLVTNASGVPASDGTYDPAEALDCWQVVSNPDVDTNTTILNVLNGVAAVTANDVWAVGNYFERFGGQKTLILHWDGSAWSMVPSPNVDPGGNNLNAIAVVSANDVWAVGYYYDPASENQALILHWNGNMWSVVPTPDPGMTLNHLTGVAAVSANDVWAVGYSVADNRYDLHTLVLHWDGSIWSVTPSPDMGTNRSYLYGVAAVSASDVWAVGYYYSVSKDQTFTLHWDGSVWSVIRSPNLETDTNVLSGVTATPAGDVWAVGYYINASDHGQALILHWNGAVWGAIPGPLPSVNNNGLRGVTAVSGNDVWAVGDYYDSSFVDRPLIIHWDGSAWSAVSSPSPAMDYNDLYDVAAVSANDIWAVGYYHNTESSAQTLIERYTPCHAICDLTFEDVSLDSTFYTYIQCMACQSIVNGYPCGGPGEPCDPNNNPYFRPAGNITRGQFAKIVSNSATFNEPPGAQQYEDVLPGSTFYDFIWRLSDRGFINGYLCGGVGEPCGPNSLPYFRPGANITRGQLAKIDSNAARYNDTPGAQQYEDVVPGSTFYDYIWRLSNRGYINGYPCGGIGEPCDPDQLLYFKPAASATRGQASKIVSNTFSPSCNP